MSDLDASAVKLLLIDDELPSLKLMEAILKQERKEKITILF